VHKIDGVAVNNEHFSSLVNTADNVKIDHLNKLDEIRTEAAKQVGGTLFTHFSLGWFWYKMNGIPYSFDWNGNSRTASEHMITIFDSVDVQVGCVAEIRS